MDREMVLLTVNLALPFFAGIPWNFSTRFQRGLL